MSEEVDGLLGIAADKPVSLRAIVGPTLYRVRRQAVISGPFTLNQLRSMWASGNLTAEMEYQAADEWKPVLELLNLLEGGRDSATHSAVASVVLQAKLKSPTVAVLLGLFLPFIGAFYGSVAAALVPFFVGIVAGFCGFIFSLIVAKPSDAEAVVIWGAIASLFAIWSLFWSLAAVKRYNAAVVADAQL